MEHPLRVDEFVPSSEPQIVVHERRRPPRLATLLCRHCRTFLPATHRCCSPMMPDYAKYLPSINLRRQLRPALRAVCKTEHAVAVMVDWVRTNNLKFAVRCGGHSYEGFSQSTDVVIDVRGLKKITVDKPNGLVTAGSGVSLYELYQALAAQGLAVQAGSCPTVGLSGHLTGGGHGLLARSHGLTCDTLRQVTIVDCQARTRRPAPLRSRICSGPAAAAVAAVLASRPSSRSACFRWRRCGCSASAGHCRRHVPRDYSRPGRPGRRTRRARSRRS